MYLSLSKDTSLRVLESPFLFNRKTDELYELGDEAFALIKKLDGTFPASDFGEKELLDYLLKEGLVELLDTPSKRDVPVRKGPLPSLRYLEVQITDRCNLRCRHCYQESRLGIDMPPELFKDILDQFEEMGGLRIIVSGGEPLVHKRFEEIAELLGSNYTFRRVLLTNGVRFFRDAVLCFDEVQVSIDGLEESHDYIRGKESFRKAMDSLIAYRDLGLDVSVATMLHSRNMDDIPKMERIFRELGVREWGIDVPCGYNDVPPPEVAARFLKYSFGGSYHGSSEGAGCGLHLMTVLPDGKVVRCGFYTDPLGRLDREPLSAVWMRKKPFDLSKTECRDCPHISECGGGCRYRAGDVGRDLYMCALFGMYVQNGSSPR